MKKICLLGSTGSIGTNTLEVIRHFPKEFRVVALAANSNINDLKKQIDEFQPGYVAIGDESKLALLKQCVNGKIKVYGGSSGIEEMMAEADYDEVLSAIVGAAGLKPTLKALKRGKKILLANKEVLVMAGQIFMEEARKRQVDIIPVDSEHSAIFQCLNGRNLDEVDSIILTASGGPFLNREGSLEDVSVEEALAHPNWKMGQKISIDSASLMNKGLELIEAYWLFGQDEKKLKVIVHPQSIIHSMVEFCDGSVIAQLGVADMKVPIQYALSFPRRLARISQPLSLIKIKTLTFQEPNLDKFPSLRLAKEALRMRGTMPCVLNAANEISVKRFLAQDIRFSDIFAINSSVMEEHNIQVDPNLDQVIEADRWAREKAELWKI